MPVLECVAVDAEWVFEIFTRGNREVEVFLLDVRPYKVFKRQHIQQSFCVRRTADERALADYSRSQYDLRWGQGVWWGRDVFVYGEADLKKTHPVLEFLSQEGKAKSLQYYKEGFEAFQSKYPYLCTASVRAGGRKTYPSVLIHGLLYLGSWEDATNHERLKEINVKSVVTIHNNPDELTLPSGIRHLKIELPDIPTADISKHFNDVYERIEAARDRKIAVLVHCGAGVSRSATLCIAYLMRRFGWGASRAQKFVLEKRKRISINQGFWALLIHLQKALGISDPIEENPVPEEIEDGVQISDEAAGIAVPVIFTESQQLPQTGQKRDRTDPLYSLPSKRPKKEDETEEVPSRNDRRLKVEVWRGEMCLGVLDIGPLRRHQRCVFGRAPNVDIRLEHASISRQHAKLEVNESGQVVLTDLGSGHGTNLDDVWIRANMPKVIKAGSRIRFAASTRLYKVVSRPAAKLAIDLPLGNGLLTVRLRQGVAAALSLMPYSAVARSARGVERTYVSCTKELQQNGCRDGCFRVSAEPSRAHRETRVRRHRDPDWVPPQARKIPSASMTRQRSVNTDFQERPKTHLTSRLQPRRSSPVTWAPLLHRAVWTASRAAEALREDALFVDPLAKHFVRDITEVHRRRRQSIEVRPSLAAPGRFELFRQDRRYSGYTDVLRRSVSYTITRTKYLDDAILVVLGDQEHGSNAMFDDVHEVVAASECYCQQVVMLGAGFDSRPWRLPLGAARWFEVDLKNVIIEKQKHLAAAGASMSLEVGQAARTHRSECAVWMQANATCPYPMQCLSMAMIAANVRRSSWIRQLEAAGLKQSVATVWVMEGLLVYLEAHHVERLLRQLCDASPVGSFLMASIMFESAVHDGERGHSKDSWKWGCPSNVEDVSEPSVTSRR